MRPLALTITVISLAACGGSSVNKNRQTTPPPPTHPTQTPKRNPPQPAGNIQAVSATTNRGQGAKQPRKLPPTPKISEPVKPKIAAEITIAAVGDIMLGSTFPPGKIAERTVKGVKVGIITFATAWHSHDLRKITDAVRVVTAAAQRYPVLIVYFHGGAEGVHAQHVPRRTEYYLGENRGNLRKFARAVIDAGADLVIGHGPHVVRGMEVYKDRLIAYSLGKFASQGFIMYGPYGYSYILEAKVTNRGKFVSGMIHSIKHSHSGGTDPDPKRRVIPVLRRLSKADFGNTAVIIDNSGSFTAPPAP